MSSELDAARTALQSAGTAAGVPAREIDDEAAAFAASICADGTSAVAAWAEAFDRSASEFGAAAARGREWRECATPILARIVAHGRDAGVARAYAGALVDLAAATATIADPSLERINAAGFAASAQLRAVSAPGSESSFASSIRRTPDAAVPDAPANPSGGSRSRPSVDAAATPSPVPVSVPEAAPPEPAPTVTELLAQLDALIGLHDVKDEIHHQAELLRVDQLRRANGLKPTDVNRHLVFTGNPGTGKTTVARLVAGIYRALGILEKGQLIETDRAGCVAGYVGQTAIKTSEVVSSALGGVLFIDEAYALATDDFGNEAIDTLVKAMEDHRNELVVIVAGYTNEMVEFIASNPGLESRFRTTITFADYSEDELVAIFEEQCRQADFTPAHGCAARLRDLLHGETRDRNFGNARYVRNQFEAAVVRQAWRLRDIASPTVEELRTLLPEDLETPSPRPPDSPDAPR